LLSMSKERVHNLKLKAINNKHYLHEMILNTPRDCLTKDDYAYFSNLIDERLGD
jgi:hypothetical protein